MRKFLSVIVTVTALTLFGCQSAPTKRTDSPEIVAQQGVSEVTPEQALPGVEAAYSQFIDVRTPEEYAAGHAYRARNIPLDQLKANLDKLERNEPVYLICQSGRRSKEAAEILVQEGFPQAISIAGGTVAWKESGLPMAEQQSGGYMENATAKKMVEKTKYGNKREIRKPFDEVVEATREALKTEGFGVLSEIRMDEKFKEKLDVDFRKYVILGACNPALAFRTVQEDIDIGLLLPCNVIVYESDEHGGSVVAAIDAAAMMSVVGDAPVVVEVSTEVNAKLRRALESI